MSTPLGYTPYPEDLARYEVANASHRFYREDPVIGSGQRITFELVSNLAASPDWEDRIRARVAGHWLLDIITLPDGFPCIYEPADSPRNADVLNPRPFVWVASPDEEMLHELLPLYRELWGAYEVQWPQSPNRSFEIGRLDGVKPHGVYLPGTTPEQVLVQTMTAHRDMYHMAPPHIKQLHPFSKIVHSAHAPVDPS